MKLSVVGGVMHNMEQIEQIECVKKITNAWEPKLCRAPVNGEIPVTMEVYHEGAKEPERQSHIHSPGQLRHEISMCR